MLVENCPTNGFDGGGNIQGATMGAIDFQGKGEFFFTVDGDGEGGAGVGAQCGVAGFGGVFQVLRIVVETPEDEDFLESSGEV